MLRMALTIKVYNFMKKKLNKYYFIYVFYYKAKIMINNVEQPPFP